MSRSLGLPELQCLSWVYAQPLQGLRTPEGPCTDDQSHSRCRASLQLTARHHTPSLYGVPQPCAQRQVMDPQPQFLHQ